MISGSPNLRASNNLDALRLLAALMVLISHAHALRGLPEPQPFALATLGIIGVNIFFAISGYLIFQSWDADPHVGRFFQRRCLRILPGLAVCIGLSMFLLGPIVTESTQAAYWSDQSTWRYAWNIALRVEYRLPGVFATNWHPHAVNGSLWSLPIEFVMYVAVALFGLARGNRWALVLATLGLGLLTRYWASSSSGVAFWGFDVRQLCFCGMYFFVGGILYRFRLARWFTVSNGLMAFAGLAALEHWPSAQQPGAWWLLPVVVLTFGLSHQPWLARLTARGDYSYGMYLYAFPVQQTIIYLDPSIGMAAFVALSMLITGGFAVASWHVVEKRALALKPRRIRP